MLTLSTCRCYEIKCVTGVVVGNITNGNNVPYNISGGYTEPGLNYATLQDGTPACLLPSHTTTELYS